jgi:hypothetical protein
VSLGEFPNDTDLAVVANLKRQTAHLKGAELVKEWHERRSALYGHLEELLDQSKPLEAALLRIRDEQSTERPPFDMKESVLRLLGLRSIQVKSDLNVQHVKNPWDNSPSEVEVVAEHFGSVAEQLTWPGEIRNRAYEILGAFPFRRGCVVLIGLEIDQIDSWQGVWYTPLVKGGALIAYPTRKRTVFGVLLGRAEPLITDITTDCKVVAFLGWNDDEGIVSLVDGPEVRQLFSQSEMSGIQDGILSVSAHWLHHQGVSVIVDRDRPRDHTLGRTVRLSIPVSDPLPADALHIYSSAQSAGLDGYAVWSYAILDTDVYKPN